MTSTYETGTPDDILPAIEMPPGVTGFGLAEVAYLLSRHRSEGAERTRGLMVLDDMVTDENFLRAGASSLVARGLLTKGQDDRSLPLSWAAVLDYALALPTTWIEVGINRSGVGDLALVLASPAVTAVLQPRVVGSWFASFVDGSQPGRALVEVLQRVVQDEPSASFVVRTSDLEGQRSELAVTSGASGQWVVDGRTTDDAGLVEAMNLG